MGIRREEEMEMSDDDMEDVPDSKDSEDSGGDAGALLGSARLCERDRGLPLMEISPKGGAVRVLRVSIRQVASRVLTRHVHIS